MDDPPSWWVESRSAGTAAQDIPLYSTVPLGSVPHRGGKNKRGGRGVKAEETTPTGVKHSAGQGQRGGARGNPAGKADFRQHQESSRGGKEAFRGGRGNARHHGRSMKEPRGYSAISTTFMTDDSPPLPRHLASSLSFSALQEAARKSSTAPSYVPLSGKDPRSLKRKHSDNVTSRAPPIAAPLFRGDGLSDADESEGSVDDDSDSDGALEDYLQNIVGQGLKPASFLTRSLDERAPASLIGDDDLLSPVSESDIGGGVRGADGDVSSSVDDDDAEPSEFVGDENRDHGGDLRSQPASDDDDMDVVVEPTPTRRKAENVKARSSDDESDGTESHGSDDEASTSDDDDEDDEDDPNDLVMQFAHSFEDVLRTSSSDSNDDEADDSDELDEDEVSPRSSGGGQRERVDTPDDEYRRAVERVMLGGAHGGRTKRDEAALFRAVKSGDFGNASKPPRARGRLTKEERKAERAVAKRHKRMAAEDDEAIVILNRSISNFVDDTTLAQITLSSEYSQKCYRNHTHFPSSAMINEVLRRFGSSPAREENRRQSGTPKTPTSASKRHNNDKPRKGGNAASSWKEREKRKSGGSAATTPVGTAVGGSAPAIAEDNIGNKMLRMMGWSPGDGLGARSHGIVEPVTAIMRGKRTGLGT